MPVSRRGVITFGLKNWPETNAKHASRLSIKYDCA